MVTMLLEEITMRNDCPTREPIRYVDRFGSWSYRDGEPKGPPIGVLLDASVGKPWDEVCAKIHGSRKWNDRRKIELLKYFVDQTGHDSHKNFFVDARGILRKNPESLWTKRPASKREKKVVMLSKNEFAYCVKGIWYAYSCKTLSDTCARELGLRGNTSLSNNHGVRDPEGSIQRTIYWYEGRYHAQESRFRYFHVSRETIESIGISVEKLEMRREDEGFMPTCRPSFFKCDGSWRVITGKKRQLGKREIRRHRLREKDESEE